MIAFYRRFEFCDGTCHLIELQTVTRLDLGQFADCLPAGRQENQSVCISKD